jgi:hypothetical protein
MQRISVSIKLNPTENTYTQILTYTHIHKYLHTHINTYIQPKDNAQCSNQISCIFSAIEHEKLRIQNSNK